MLVPLLERSIWPLAIYSIISGVLYTFRGPLPNIITAILFSLATVWIGRSLVLAVSREIKLDRLGKRAWGKRSYAWTPFNIGVLLEALSYFFVEQTYEWWSMTFKHGNPRNPYTVEAIIVNERIIFTADEENIKAILASQFAEFGKGPQFRKEWKDFLGLSIFTTDGSSVASRPRNGIDVSIPDMLTEEQALA